MARATLLDIVDAIWRIDAPEEEWLTTIARTVAANIDDSPGSMAYMAKLDDGALSTLSFGGDAAFRAIVDALHACPNVSSAVAHYGFPAGEGPNAHLQGRRRPKADVRLSRFRFDAARVPTDILKQYRSLGFYEGLTIRSLRDAGSVFMCGVAFPDRRPTRTIDQVRRRRELRWAPLAHHVRRALVLRRALRRGEVVADIDRRGRGDFASPHQRSAVRDHLDRALHARKARDADDGLSRWDQLLAGRFSIVRRQERGGAVRFWAIENQDEEQLRRLTAQEVTILHGVVKGASNKRIAIELGVSEPTVANKLKAAMRKIGVRRRAEIARLAAVLERR